MSSWLLEDNFIVTIFFTKVMNYITNRRNSVAKGINSVAETFNISICVFPTFVIG